jgi:hypothetical protein
MLLIVDLSFWSNETAAITSDISANINNIIKNLVIRWLT